MLYVLFIVFILLVVGFVPTLTGADIKDGTNKLMLVFVLLSIVGILLVVGVYLNNNTTSTEEGGTSIFSLDNRSKYDYGC